VDDKELRERMKGRPFAPTEGSTEHRIAAAAEYIAYYLGEIEAHLSKAAAHAEADTPNLSRLATAAVGIQAMLPALIKR
jgi:hypothetical protein